MISNSYYRCSYLQFSSTYNFTFYILLKCNDMCYIILLFFQKSEMTGIPMEMLLPFLPDCWVSWVFLVPKGPAVGLQDFYVEQYKYINHSSSYSIATGSMIELSIVLHPKRYNIIRQYYILYFCTFLFLQMANDVSSDLMLVQIGIFEKQQYY